MNQPLVSICCITYNHGKYIRDCIEGFLMQKCNFSYEILINDDASNDGTQTIIQEYMHRYPEIIKPIFHSENQYSKGQRGFNFKYNFPRAKGKYIAMCEGDDFWTDPDKLQIQVDLLEKESNIVLCSHNVNRIDESCGIIKPGIVSDDVKYFTSSEIFHNQFPTLSLVFRNVDLAYTDEFKNAFNGDAILTGLLSRHGGAAHFGFVGATYRIHSGGVYSQNNYYFNQQKSIATRKLMLKSPVF